MAPTAFDTLDKESDERRARAAVGTIKEALRTARRNTAPLVQTIRERAAAIVAAEIAAQASAEETSSLRIGIPFVPSHRVGALQLLHKQFTDPIFPNNCEPRNQLHGLITF